MLKRHGPLVVLTLILAFQISDSRPVFAQVATNVWGNNDPRRYPLPIYVSSGAHTVRTTESGGKMRVETYLNGYYMVTVCRAPGINGGLGEMKMGVWDPALGACYNEFTGGEVRAEHFIGNEVPFGWYTGFGHHFFIDDSGQWFNLGRTVSSRFFDDLAAPTCEDDPTQPQCPNTPIIIRLSPSGRDQESDRANNHGRNDYRLTDAKHGVFFDLDGNGRVERIGWTAHNADLAFLAIDRNGNGTIDSGAELFGDHTLPGTGNGFKALRELSGVEAGWIDATSPFWATLLLWTDANHDGISQPAELQPVGNVLTKIGLGYSMTLRTDANGHQVLDTPTDQFGNIFQYRGWVEYRDDIGKTGRSRLERQRPCYDVILAR